MKTVKLWDIVGCILICPGETGIEYTNQVNGTACEQPVQEGFIIPLDHDYPIEQPELLLANQLINQFKDNSCGELTQQHADSIDLLLERFPETAGVSVDRTRLKNSCESWVWVKCVESSYSCFEGFGNFNAILTWCNSD